MDAVAEYAKLVGYGKSPLEYLRENNGFVTTNKKAAIKREQSDARISSAEREQARPQVKGEEDVSVACILLFVNNENISNKNINFANEIRIWKKMLL